MTGNAYYAWSGGKDAAYGLHRAQDDQNIQALFTTVNTDYDRVSIHGVPTELVERQADAIGLPLYRIDISSTDNLEDYQQTMSNFYSDHAGDIDTLMFADIYLEDVRESRETLAEDEELTTDFPLWGSDTEELGQAFIDQGFKAVVVCVDGNQLDRSFAGREYDSDFLDDLPDSVDPCGEDGEFHTFVYDGPLFDTPIDFEKGRQVTRDVAGGENHYLELQPRSSER